MYEVFTREHVAGLAEYFRARAADVIGAGAARSRSLRVLELGAGSGALHRALAAATRALDAHAGSPRRAKTCSVTYHATDDYSFLARRPRMVSDAAANEKQSVVARLDYRDALRAPRGACDGHPPDVVLICWHPIREDWTRTVRLTPSVFEYVLVGEPDFGACIEMRIFRLRAEVEEALRDSAAALGLARERVQVGDGALARGRPDFGAGAPRRTSAFERLA